MTKFIDSISFVRFPMIMGIIIIHSYLCGNSVFIAQENSYRVAFYVQYLFSNIISRSCVPLFFLISGFLFFYNINSFDSKKYFAKLKRRVHSLLIPYLLWNLVAFALLVFEKLPFMNQFFPGLANKQLSLSFFLSCFWSSGDINYNFFDNGGMPLDFPLWFIRNLIILSILTPLIYNILKTKWGGVIVAVLLVCFIFGIWPQIDGFSCTGVCFFCIGAFMSIHKMDSFLSWNKSILILGLYVILCIADLMTIYNPFYNQIFHALMILSGTYSISFIANFFQSKGVSMPGFLIHATFFIYAFHGLFSNILKKIVILTFSPSSNLGWIACYICVIGLLTSISLIAYLLSVKISPRITSILCGNR